MPLNHTRVKGQDGKCEVYVFPLNNEKGPASPKAPPAQPPECRGSHRQPEDPGNVCPSGRHFPFSAERLLGCHSF